jgi:uncharacterized protein (DUF58 family)
MNRLGNWAKDLRFAPAYSGWVMAGLALFFFAAATNTMAGWLYVISGVMMAVLIIGAVVASRMLQGIQIRRSPIASVQVGKPLSIEIWVENRTSTVKSLLQVEDCLPFELGKLTSHAIERIPAQGVYRWQFQRLTHRRGVFHWKTIVLKTAAPFGLLWYRQHYALSAEAIVYPVVLPLSQCPLLERLEAIHQPIVNPAQSASAATEGLTRTLRPYRWGDPIRLVHWRTSARCGELRIRELETYSTGQPIVLSLDSATTWEEDSFEQAVIAVASLYSYALQRSLPVQIWTAGRGLVQGERSVLETLASVQFGEARLHSLPGQPVIWLSPNPDSLNTLPTGSRWVLWQTVYVHAATLQERQSAQNSLLKGSLGLLIHPQQPLQPQLQATPFELG